MYLIFQSSNKLNYAYVALVSKTVDKILQRDELLMAYFTWMKKKKEKKKISLNTRKWVGTAHSSIPVSELNIQTLYHTLLGLGNILEAVTKGFRESKITTKITKQFNVESRERIA